MKSRSRLLKIIQFERESNMRGNLSFSVGQIIVVYGAILLNSPLPSYAENLPNSLIFLESTTEELAQLPNSEGDPNENKLVQPGESPQPLRTDTETPVEPDIPPETTSTPTPTIESVQVQKVQVSGSTIFTSEELSSITKSVEGRTVSLEELRKVAEDITKLYLDRGYITSRAILLNQTITESVVQIQVIEGGIEKIEVQGTKRLNPDYVRSRVALVAGKPLSTTALEDQLKLLKIDPLFSNVEASLRTGSEVGQNILVIKVTESQPFNVGLSVDNYSPPSIGSERLGVNLSYQNITGRGDTFSTSYYHTTRSGADIFDFSYRIPLNPMDGTLQLRAGIQNFDIIEEQFKALDIHGDSQLYEISYRQPLLRSLRREFALSLAFTAQNGQTFTFAGATPFGFGPDENGNSRTRVVKFGQDYIQRDVQGVWSLQSVFSFGLNALDATTNSAPIPDGQFFSWFGQIQRVQRLSDNNFLIAQADIQLTPDSLLPSQQFIIGGGQSVRGYRQNARAGDNGIRFRLEDNLILQRNASGSPSFQIGPFFDLGYVWNVENNPNILQKQKFLAGLGVGLSWQMNPGLDLRLDYALPLTDLEDRGTNAQDDGFYFRVSYRR